jgi:hypothetical protein
MPSKDALEPMVRSSKYSGYSRRSYLPLEALDSGDPQAKIIAFLDKIRRTFAA